MKIYDKALWHIDAGENQREVLTKFKLIFSFLEKSGLLTNEGKEILDIGIDSSAVLHERMVTDKGKLFLDSYYDSVINTTVNMFENKLQLLFDQSKNK